VKKIGWKDLFAEHILERGYTIPIGAISDVAETETEITATITGHKKYAVSVKKDFSEISCSCPCKGFHCKHEAALFYYIESSKPRFFDNFIDSALYLEVAPKLKPKRFYRWENEQVGDYDLFLMVDGTELTNLMKIFPNIRESSLEFWQDDKYYFFINTKKKTITPLPDYTLAFSSLYYFPPYGEEQNVEIDFTQYKLTEYDGPLAKYVQEKKKKHKK